MRQFTIYDLFVRNSRISATATAIVANNLRLTFSQLHGYCEHLAARLVTLGVQHGDRVAVVAFNHPGFFVLFGAAAKLGAIIVPLNWRLSNDELKYILKDSAPKILFADVHHQEKAREIAESLHIPIATLDETLTCSTTPKSTSFPSTDVSSNTPLCIIYTAAVEGVPRGAVLSHNNLISANLQVIASMGLSGSDTHLAMLPLFHITGLNLALAVMHLGGKNVIMEKFNEEQALSLTLAENVTLWGSFPPILQRMVEEISKRDALPKTLKYVVGLDGPDAISTFEKITSAKFWILYGQSETSGFVTFSQASDKLGSAGKQGHLSNYILVDEEDQAVARGETGEIVVQGPLVFQGYWRQDALNQKTFRNGWHHTGDLGQTDEDGYLIYKGRKPEKELIKPGGENVYPAEVEAVIMQHPAILSVSVIGVPDAKFGEGVKAVCVVQPGSQLTDQELIEFVGSRIARYKKPGYVEFVTSLPMDGDTIDRIRVKELYGG